MRILMVDDEEHTMADHRFFLRQAGHEVVSTTRLTDAVKKLEASFSGDKFDLVLIDLMLPGQMPPTALESYYRDVPANKNNEGQVLGQWLWEHAGARKEINRPIHCYFANIPEMYKLHSDYLRQEFDISLRPGQFNISFARQFILEKTMIAPSKMEVELINIKNLWVASGFFAAQPNQGGQP